MDTTSTKPSDKLIEGHIHNKESPVSLPMFRLSSQGDTIYCRDLYDNGREKPIFKVVIIPK